MAEEKRVLVRTVINDKSDVESRLQAAILMIHHMKERLDKVEDELKFMTFDFEQAKQELMYLDKYSCSFCECYYDKDDLFMCSDCDYQLCEECSDQAAEEMDIKQIFYRCRLHSSDEIFCYKCASDELKKSGKCVDCSFVQQGGVVSIEDYERLCKAEVKKHYRESIEPKY